MVPGVLPGIATLVQLIPVPTRDHPISQNNLDFPEARHFWLESQAQTGTGTHLIDHRQGLIPHLVLSKEI